MSTILKYYIHFNGWFPESWESWLQNQYYNFYNPDYWNKNCDPRVVNQWLMHNGPYRLFIISFLYLFLIWFGVGFMKQRQAFQIRLPMLIFNLTLVLVNMYFFQRSFWWMNYGKDLLDFRFPSQHDRSPRAMAIVQLYYYYQLSKFFDYVDTMFLILRKKNDHITMLHVYHHFTVPIVGWLSNWINPTMPVLGLFTMLNSLCHIIMYAYYAVSALGPRYRPYLWWKPYITRIQLFQFLIIGLYGLELNVKHQGYPLLFRVTILSQAIIYLIMFGNFYKKSYGQQQQRSPAQQQPEMPQRQALPIQQDGDDISNEILTTSNKFLEQETNNGTLYNHNNNHYNHHVDFIQNQ